MKRRDITAKLVRRGPEEDEFDRAFWRGVRPEKRIEALWDMVLELDAWRESDGGQPRLQRSVCQLQRTDDQVADLSGGEQEE